jgi:tetraacyldisaccharide 4'-kinase
MQVREQCTHRMRSGDWPKPLVPALFVLSQAYRGVVAARNQAYKRGWLKSKSLPAAVVSVGNIAVGGTGKTPCVQLLCQHLSKQVPLAILSRGYLSSVERMKEVAEVNPDAPEGAALYGDEPLLLAKTTGVPVWVGSDRFASGFCAVQAGARCLILDDGLQHRKLRRSVEIIVVDGKDPLCGGRFLPLGLLRDSLKRLKEADLIVATRIHTLQESERVESELSRFTEAPVVCVRSRCEVPTPVGTPVGAFCAIGHPEQWIEQLEGLGQRVVATYVKADHAPFSYEELVRFAERARFQGAEALLCTEKDHIKLSGLAQLPLPLFSTPMTFQFVAGEQHWYNQVKNILNKARS